MWPPLIPDHQLITKVGEGGYGEVWLARSATGGWRAVKLVQRSRFDQERPFHREFEGLRQFAEVSIREPRQLALLHVGFHENDGYLYAIMELADDIETGQSINPDQYQPATLGSIWRKRGRLPVSEAVGLGIEVAHAVASLHRNGLVHRDIKPSNIIFVRGVPKLADLGLVTLPQPGISFVGTPGYVPPEGPGTFKADIYALGKVLYQLSTGNIAADYPELPADLAYMPDRAEWFELNEIVHRSCDRDPTLRYSSADALLDDLSLLRAGKSVIHLRRAEKRVKTLVRIGVLLGILTCFAGGYAWFQRSQRNHEAVLRYKSDLNLAASWVIQGRYGLAREALPSKSPIHRNRLDLELVQRLSFGDPSMAVQVFNHPIRRIVFDQNSNRLAVAAENEVLAVLGDRTGTRPMMIEPFGRLAGFSIDGSHISGTAVKGEQQQLMLWQVESGRAVELDVGGDWLPIRMLSDGSMVRVSRQAPHRFWRRDSGGADNELQLPDKYPTNSILLAFAMNLDGSRLALQVYEGVNETLKVSTLLWDLRKNHLQDIRIDSSFEIIALSQAGDWFGCIDRTNNRIIAGRWKEEFERLPKIEPLDSEIRSIAISDVHGHLAVGTAAERIHVFATADGSLRHTLRGHRSGVSALEWLDNGSRLASGDTKGELRVWDLEQSTPPRVQNGFRGGRVAVQLITNPSETSIALSGVNQTVEVWGMTPWKRLTVVSNAATPILLTDPPRPILHYVNSEGSLVTLDLGLGSTVQERPLFENTIVNSQNTIGLVAPDHNHAVFYCENRVLFWQFNRGTPSPIFEEHQSAVEEVVFSPDSRKALTLKDNEIVLWDLETEKPVRKRETLGRSDVLKSGCFLADGNRCLLGGDMSLVYLYDVAEDNLEKLDKADMDSVTQMLRVGEWIIFGGSDSFLTVRNASPPFEKWAMLGNPAIPQGQANALTRMIALRHAGQLLGLTEAGTLVRW